MLVQSSPLGRRIGCDAFPRIPSWAIFASSLREESTDEFSGIELAILSWPDAGPLLYGDDFAVFERYLLSAVVKDGS